MKLHRPLILAAAAMTTAACSHAGSNDDAFRWTTQLPPGAVLHVRDGAGDIRVTRATGNDLSLRASTRWRRGRERDIKFVTTQRGNDYYVCAMWRNSGRCDGNYRGRNTGGLLALLSLFHRTSDASADFDVQVPANVFVDARTSLGSVDVQGANAGVKATTVNGTIRASNVSGSLVLSTTNGDVRVSADSLSPSDSLKFTTTNGSVHAELPKGTEGRFDLSTVNGSVQSDIQVPVAARGNGIAGRRLAGQVGTATRLVKMHVINGEVVVATR